MRENTKSKQVQTAINDGKVNGIHMETLLGTVNAIEQDPELGACKFRARNKWLDGNQNRTMTATITADTATEHGLPSTEAYNAIPK